ncbi:MAG: ATP-dependent DNA helicase DinG, partial [Cellvibrionaceae bacterium]
VANCSFFKAREAIDRTDCIVVNHDLVLADLALGGGMILPPPEEAIYIFDEGHHLPEKALKHFAYHTRITATGKWLEQCQNSVPAMIGDVADAGQVEQYANALPSVFLEIRQLFETAYTLCQPLFDEANMAVPARSSSNSPKRHRFVQGTPPQSFIELASDLERLFEQLQKKLWLINEEFQSFMDASSCPVPRVDLENWSATVGSWIARTEANHSLWSSYARADISAALPTARWLTLVESAGSTDFEVCSSPILAADMLNKSLWKRCYGAVITSATLRALGTFERFKMCSGIDDKQLFDVMPSAFEAQRAQLVIPDNAVEANSVQKHTDYLVSDLPELLTKEKGSLVLFASRKQMEDVYHQLPHELRKTILMQGDVSKQRMIALHKQQIDDGASSVLFGLASFAEGVDLPGDYCRHLILAKLPFSVPDDPVEATQAEWIDAKGGNAFMDISVADASMRMIQACGRLLRTENDSGVITILDKRLLTKRYGRLLLNILPEYAGKSTY